MSFFLDRRRLIVAGSALVAAPRVHAQGRGPDVFEIAASETATIDGRHWNTPIVGGTTVDAVHRAVLLRFPTAADEIADLLRSGRVLVRAELALRYGAYEIVPDGYTCRDGMGRQVWTDNPPSWHIQAWALRHAWKADRETGPTFNASVNGKRYWARYGAADARDRSDEADRGAGAVAVRARGAVRRHPASVDRRARTRGRRAAALARAERLPAAQGRDLRLALSRRRCL